MRSVLRAIVLVALLATAAHAQSPTPTITPVSGQDCCVSHVLPGCDDSVCEACICVGNGISNDPGCCGIAGEFPNKWDWQCSQEAKGLYTVLVSCADECACSVAYQTATPTVTPTRTVTRTQTASPTRTVTAGATVTPIPLLCCDCATEDCVPPVANVCPTPCVPVPNAVCP